MGAAFGLAAAALAPMAWASERALTFNLPRQRVLEALLDLAVQARAPLGGDLSACRGSAPALRGSMTLRDALDRLLAGSGCDYVIRPDGAVIVRRAPPPGPVVAAPPASQVPRTSALADAVAQLAEVVVTAERRPETPQHAPAAMTALSKQQMIAAGAQDANDLGALVAGMVVTNLGSGRNKILLRGMSDGAFTGLTQSTVGVYLDRAPLTYSAPDPDLKLIDVERVEVLRGPQGTLFGLGSIGGVLRIAPAAPDTAQEVLELNAAQSLTRGGGRNSDYSLIANLPAPAGRGALRVALYAEEFGGYINDVNLNLRRVNDGARQGGRLAAALSPTPDWTLSAGVARQRIDTQDTHYVYRTLGGLRRANLVREPHANIFGQAHASVEGRGAWGRVEATISRVAHDFDSRYDASVALPGFGSNGRVGALDEGKRIDLTVAEIVFTSPPGRRLGWLAGVFAAEGEARSETVLSTLGPFRARAYAETRHDAFDERAMFGEVSYELTPRLTLVGGGRYSVRHDATGSLVVQDTGSRPFEGRGRDAGLSPKLALDYRAGNGWSYYAQVSQGRRAGGFNTAGPIGQPFIGAEIKPSRRYDGDTLWNYEIGAKGELAERRMQLRVALFRALWRDIQSDQFLPSGLAYAVNVGDGANTGLEVEANWRPTPSLEVRVNGLLADPEITRPSQHFNSRGDAGLPGVPAVSANLNLMWRRPIDAGLDVFADANLAYVGPSRLTFDAARRHRMGDYVNGRVALGLAGARWRVTGFIDNPFDSQANTFSFSDPFRLPQALATTPLRPRTIGVALGWRL